VHLYAAAIFESEKDIDYERDLPVIELEITTSLLSEPVKAVIKKKKVIQHPIPMAETFVDAHYSQLSQRLRSQLLNLHKYARIAQQCATATTRLNGYVIAEDYEDQQLSIIQISNDSKMEKARSKKANAAVTVQTTNAISNLEKKIAELKETESMQEKFPMVVFGSFVHTEIPGGLGDEKFAGNKNLSRQMCLLEKPELQMFTSSNFMKAYMEELFGEVINSVEGDTQFAFQCHSDYKTFVDTVFADIE
jgi:hypothetical protein